MLTITELPSVACTSAFLQSRFPSSDPCETATTASELHRLAVRFRAGKRMGDMPDLEGYGLSWAEYDGEEGRMLVLVALDNAEPVAWGKVIVGTWAI